MSQQTEKPELIRTEKGIYTGGIYAPTWAEYCGLIERLSNQIKAAHYQPDCVIALARGGLLVGNILSRELNCPLGVMATRRSKKGVSGGVAIAGSVACGYPVEGRILIADDLIEFGSSMAASIQAIQAMPGVVEIKTAVIWRKIHDIQNKPKSDFCASEIYPPVPWIIQPFERYDREQPKVISN